MPFKSRAEQGWMFANKPRMAKQFAAETPDMAALPDHVKRQRSAKQNALLHIMRGGTSYP